MNESGFACVVGAPRCGTTSLASFIKNHPDVCFSSVKEPHYFSQYDLTELSSDEVRQCIDERYLPRYFSHASGSHPLLAEASVTYLYTPDRMGPILQRWPDAKFVIAVRDPLEMLPSLHQRLMYLGDETETDFGKAWALSSEREQGRSIPRTCVDPRWLRYDEAGRLGTHVENFFRVVGRERCMVVVFDDLATNPAALHRRLTDFLGLAPQETLDLGARRTSMSYRFGWLQRLLKRPPIATRALLAGEAYRQRVGQARSKGPDSAIVRAVLAGRKRLLRWNKVPAPPVRLPDWLRREICETLAGEINHLSRLIDRDLSHWLDGTIERSFVADPGQQVEALVPRTG
ncbi:MAG TPA: sulfotransferase [Sphingomicrobium sp.]|nr:sulfotransferase [Sphingomicrobium sp.]